MFYCDVKCLCSPNTRLYISCFLFVVNACSRFNSFSSTSTCPHLRRSTLQATVWSTVLICSNQSWKKNIKWNRGEKRHKQGKQKKHQRRESQQRAFPLNSCLVHAMSSQHLRSSHQILQHNVSSQTGIFVSIQYISVICSVESLSPTQNGSRQKHLSDVFQVFHCDINQLSYPENINKNPLNLRTQPFKNSQTSKFNLRLISPPIKVI